MLLFDAKSAILQTEIKKIDLQGNQRYLYKLASPCLCMCKREREKEREREREMKRKLRYMR
jgi:hypothetical protein